MANNDGSVEVRITGSVDPSLGKSADQAKAAIAGIGDSAKISAADLQKALAATNNDLDKATKLLGEQARASAATATATEGVAAAMMEEGATVRAATDAVRSNAAVHVNSRAAYEATVLVHEAMMGRFSRMPGSLMIMAQRMAGTAATANFMSAAFSATGLAVIGTTAAVILGAVAFVSYENEQRKLIETAIGLGAASGLSARQIEAAGEAAADASGKSVVASTEAAEAFASAGIKSEATIATLAASVQTYAALTGEKAADAQKTLAEAMKDPIKGAEELNTQLGILDSTQIEQIRTMVDAGDKTGAVKIITEALTQRTKEANDAGIGLNSTFQDITASASNLFHALGGVVDQLVEFERFAQSRGAGGSTFADFEGRKQSTRDEASRLAEWQAANNKASAAGGALAGKTPEGQFTARRDELKGQIQVLQDAISAEQMLALQGKDVSEAKKRETESLHEYQRALATLIPDQQKAHEMAQLDAQIATARKGHDADRVASLTRQRELLKDAGEVKSQAQVDQEANDAGSKAGARAGGAGPGAVQRWTEQLHQQEIASGDFFKDQTENELAFWKSKADIAGKGSKDWMEVQDKIFTAQKTLAHEEYKDHLATLDDQLAADKGAWAKEQADMAEKLAYIKSKNGEESAEYKRQHREIENAERQHQNEVMRAQEDGMKRALEALKASLATERQIREDNARSAESVIRYNSGSSPLGEISAALQIAQSHAQLARQEMADAQNVYQLQTGLLNKQIADERAKGTESSELYKNAIQNKLAADRQYALQKKAIDARATQQQLQDILTLKQAYHSYIDGTVGATVHGFSAMIGGAMTWQQALGGIYSSLVGMVEQQIAKMIENWIVAEFTKRAATEGTGKATVASMAALAGAGGVASMAAAPFPLDLGAPAFGAEMAAAAAAYGVGASLAQGVDALPRDMLIQAHEGERVMPAADNRAIIAALNGGGGSRGDTHLHYAPQLSGDTKPFRQQLVDHSNDLFSMIRTAMRNGTLKAA